MLLVRHQWSKLKRSDSEVLEAKADKTDEKTSLETGKKPETASGKI